jgi:hypothetical protein
MKRTVSRLHHILLLTLSSAGRERARRLHAAETDALLSARRMRMLRHLACIGQYQLAIADLARRQAVAAHPDAGLRRVPGLSDVSGKPLT